jgi:hypothetical protein
MSLKQLNWCGVNSNLLGTHRRAEIHTRRGAMGTGLTTALARHQVDHDGLVVASLATGECCSPATQ